VRSSMIYIGLRITCGGLWFIGSDPSDKRFWNGAKTSWSRDVYTNRVTVRDNIKLKRKKGKKRKRNKEIVLYI